MGSVTMGAEHLGKIWYLKSQDKTVCRSISNVMIFRKTGGGGSGIEKGSNN